MKLNLENLENKETSIIQDKSTDIQAQDYTKFSTKMKSILHEKKFSDVSIQIGTRKLAAHRLVLADKSSFFFKKFEEDPKTKTIEILETGFDIGSFEIMLNFMYDGEINEVSLNKNLESLLSLAKRFDCPELNDYLEANLVASIDEESLLDKFKIAETFQLTELNDKLLEKFNENPKAIVESSQFKKFSTMYPNLFNKLFKFWIKKNQFHLSLIDRAPDIKPISERFDPENDYIKNFHKMFKEDKFADVTFLIDKKELKAHKVILSAQSSYFEAMFAHDSKENRTNEVPVTDVNPEVFEELLRYIYCKQVANLKNCALGLFQAADKYNLLKLKEICAAFLEDNINADNVLEIFHFSRLHNHAKLEFESLEYLKSYIVNVIASPGWDDFISDKLEIVSSILLEKINFVELKMKDSSDWNKPISFGTVNKPTFHFSPKPFSFDVTSANNSATVSAAPSTLPSQRRQINGIRLHPRFGRTSN